MTAAHHTGKRADHAQAERDLLAGALRGLNEAALAFYEHALPHEEMFNGQDHDRFVALDNALAVARAALARTEQP